MITPATLHKREQLHQFIVRVMAPETAVKGIVGVGSIATGRCRPDSDIDAVVFLEPFDEYIVPAEAIWDPHTDTFHSIFTQDKAIHAHGLQLDFKRLPWQKWCLSDFEWPEEIRHELGNGWIAYDPTGAVEQLIGQRTIYPDDLRQQRLDEAVTWLDQHLNWDAPETNWQNLGPARALDRLQAAYHYLIVGLFAYNYQWQGWRNRELDSVLRLAWLPRNFDGRVLLAANTSSLDHVGYQMRVQTLKELFAEFQEALLANDDYESDPIEEAFIRTAEEPGRAWNMDAWNHTRQERLRLLTGKSVL
ncbi:MAG TPA: nucleotidyltransferase domain-containing protein [Chloroflexota bacterium]|nr:nucleotidyltransferase domain-containing protein [Chloroflexota bacterium]